MQSHKVNNFDLIRLVAAFQVLIYHAHTHLHIFQDQLNLWKFVSQFPGVPIFFFISGYLITASFERNRGNLLTYLKNRFYRIYPALWMCLLITIAILLYFGFWGTFSKYAVWVLAQASFVQYYTPDFLRPFGVGNPNGSLWSIVVELQFYAILPLICMALRKLGSNIYKNIFVLLVMALSYAFGYLFEYNNTFNNSFKNISILELLVNESQHNTLYYKVFATSVIMHLYQFGFGILFYINRQKLIPLVQNKFVIWAVIYLLYYFIFSVWFQKYYSAQSHNFIEFTSIILLAFLVFSAAYTMPNLSGNVLKGNDISYGIYIYHMPIMNALIQSGFGSNLQKMLISIIIISILAIASWIYVEKPMLNLKNK